MTSQRSFYVNFAQQIQIEEFFEKLNEDMKKATKGKGLL